MQLSKIYFLVVVCFLSPLAMLALWIAAWGILYSCAPDEQSTTVNTPPTAEIVTTTSTTPRSRASRSSHARPALLEPANRYAL